MIHAPARERNLEFPLGHTVDRRRLVGTCPARGEGFHPAAIGFLLTLVPFAGLGGRLGR
jgi:hypothetical protein